MELFGERITTCETIDQLCDPEDSIEVSAKSLLTRTRPLRRKLRMRWFFFVSKVKKSSFFKSDITDALSQIFDAHLFKNTMSQR